MPTTIGVHTHITNPLSSGYLAYLASIKSWARVADELVVVDGGSEDNSIEALHEWLGQLTSRVRIISSPSANWGPGDQWYWPQIAINRQIGLEELSTDWAIHVDADHVLPRSVSRRKIQDGLEALKNGMLVSFWVGVVEAGKHRSRLRKRSWIVNKRRARLSQSKIGYGIDEDSGSHLDYPIMVRKVGWFLDPLNGAEKQYLVGDHVETDGDLDIECIRYGHFFFTLGQCMKKCERLDRILARYVGRLPMSRRELSISSGLRYQTEQIPPLSKNLILSWPHPEEIERLIAHFYSPGMLGGMIPEMELRAKIDNLFLPFLRSKRFLRSKWLNLLGYRGGNQVQSWGGLGDENQPRLDVRSLYLQQDNHLPSRYRVNWRMQTSQEFDPGIYA